MDNEIEYFEPDYADRCTNDGQSPTVVGVLKGGSRVVWHLCGPCCFGTAAALDPEWWNGGEDEED